MKALTVLPGFVIRQHDGPNVGSYEWIRNELNGGMLEYLSLTPRVHCYLDEEGKLRGLPANELMDGWVHNPAHPVGLSPYDVIVGPVVILGSISEQGVRDGDEHSVPEAFAEDFLRWATGTPRILKRTVVLESVPAEPGAAS